ncbi:hypothetical protein [Poseidonibacter ostreae]|uniref:Uncharacterized protein n=1 Tax=Poseidonibacter ostreae TaxID=2654171 RepID=A0A6L4WZE5_9BACT|nr:hypothetical protein [Poseidonibacter ostreae]KAB7891384.1 hypothetical protein GBG19_00680 [Poseidonibacter ostreae]
MSLEKERMEKERINKEVAQDILSQLGGGKTVSLMLGVANFVIIDKGIIFKFQGNDTVNHAKIELVENDTYKVTFSKLAELELEELEVYENIYCDMLIKTFESYTKLYLSL